MNDSFQKKPSYSLLPLSLVRLYLTVAASLDLDFFVYRHQKNVVSYLRKIVRHVVICLLGLLLKN